jgi:acyl-coenzyme A synthetase/AMP-(fatty) acid ligase
VLIDCPDVDDACVVGVYAEEQATDLPLAFVVVSAESKNKKKADLEAAIHQLVNERVASYKRLRGGIKFVDTIPKSPSGKILRRLLRDSLKEEKPKAKL